MYPHLITSLILIKSYFMMCMHLGPCVICIFEYSACGEGIGSLELES